MFPDNMSVCTLTVGSVLAMVDGQQCPFAATTRPVFGDTTTHLVWSDGTIIPDIAQSKEAAAGDTIDFLVPHVDQKGFLSPSGRAASGWAYQVEITVAGRTWQKLIKPLVGQSSIDVDLQPSDEVTSTVYAPPAPVLSVNGMTGNVVLDPYLVVPLTDSDDLDTVTTAGTYTSPAVPTNAKNWPVTEPAVLDVRGSRDVVLQTVNLVRNPALVYRRTGVNRSFSPWAVVPTTTPTEPPVYVYAGDGSYEVR